MTGQYPVSISSQADKADRQVSVWRLLAGTEPTDPVSEARASHIELELKDPKHLIVRLHDKQTVLKTNVIRGRIKDEYFQKKHAFKLSGLPPVLWSVSSAKMRLGLGSGRQLYINTASESNGGFLLFLAGTPGTTRSLTVDALQ